MLKFKKSNNIFLCFFILFVLTIMIIVGFPIINANDTANAETEEITPAVSYSLRAQESYITKQEYYITNFYANKHLQSDNNGNGYTEGEITELWGFTNSWRQKWYISPIDGTYYSIGIPTRSVYLSIKAGNEDKNGKSVVLAKYAPEDYRQQWRIEQTVRGTYIIRPRSGENYSKDWCMCAGFNLFNITDGLNVEQKEYKNDNDYKDEWMLSPESFYLSLEPQVRSSLCWAAAVRMASLRYMNSQISQESLAVYMKTTDNERTLYPTTAQIDAANSGVTIYQMQKAMDYILGNGKCSIINDQIYAEETLKQIINLTPVIAGRVKYDDLGKAMGGHAVVIYKCYFDTRYNCNVFTIYDPEPVNQGQIYQCSYSSLCNGRKYLGDWDHSDGSIWHRALVPIYTADNNNTIPRPTFS